MLRDLTSDDEKTSIFPTLFNHAGIYSIFTLTSNIITVITLSAFTRLLGVERFGIYSYLQAVILFVSTSSTQWIIQAVFRYRSKGDSQITKDEFDNLFFVLAATYSFFILIVSFIVFKLFSVYLVISVFEYFTYVVLLIISNAWIALYQALYQADLRPGLSSVFILLRNISRLIFPGIVLYIYDNFELFMLSIFISELLTLSTMVIKLKGKNIINKTMFQNYSKYIKILSSFWGYGWPMVGWFVCAQIIAVSDRFILQFYNGNEAVGKYVPNYTIAAMGVSVITAPIITAIHPLLMVLINNSKDQGEDIENAIYKLSRYYLIASIPFALLIFLFRKSISYFILGSSFSEGVIVFGPVIFGILVWNLSNLAHKPLEVQNKTGKMLVFIAVSATINVLLELLLIPNYGYLGAAISTVVAYISYLVLVFFATRKGIKWRFPLSTAFRLSLVCIIFIYLFEDSPITRLNVDLFLSICHGFIVGGCIFIAVLFSGEVNIKSIFKTYDRKIMKNKQNKL